MMISLIVKGVAADEGAVVVVLEVGFHQRADPVVGQAAGLEVAIAIVLVDGAGQAGAGAYRTVDQ